MRPPSNFPRRCLLPRDWRFSSFGNVRLTSHRSGPSACHSKLFTSPVSASSSQFLYSRRTVNLSETSGLTARRSESVINCFPPTVGVVPRLRALCPTTNARVAAAAACSCRGYSYKFKPDLTNSGTGSRQANSRRFTLSAKDILEASPLSVQPYLKLIRFDRPIGTWLLYLPCTWSISLAAPAGQLPDAWMLALFALGSFSMRAAACTINDMWDKDYDAKVARTRDRPLACGQISQFKALTFLALPLSVSLGILLSFNWNTVALGACSMIPCIMYPLMKRVTYWPQAFLGITLNWGVMIAWSAIHGSLDLPGFVLYLSCVLWTMIYDTIYAHQDKYDDIHAGVKSTALKFGDQSKTWLLTFATGVTGGLTTAGYLCHQPWLYYVGVGTVMTSLVHQIYSVNLSDPESCGQTFRATRNLGLLFWAFIVGAGLMAGDKAEKVNKNEITNS